VALCRVQLVEELQALARQVMALQERNQQQMAEEIHARLLQDLAVADLFLGDAQEAFRPEEIHSAREVLTEISAYLRTVLFELQPPAWENSDLVTALKDYVWNYRRRRGLPVVFQGNEDGSGVQVSEEVRVAVYRILQESLNNARKHAQAHEIVVALDVQPEWVRLEVRDDGVGFDVPVYLGPYVERGHLGLVGMRERAAEVGAQLHVESQPGQGTRVSLEVPLGLA
jgi:signal transduction histidine kinase